jgi:UDP-N-acetylglucosamine 2-epimerase (non-hydrolysing)/GDP/UDP-N,N'-diacetylbacillosamine 2-epimerase (hydrolysing)
MGAAYKLLAPDIVLLQGDRYEILASAIAAHLAGIPIAHTHGGELTEGAVDDAFRHSITKMASLHFVAMPEYAARVVQLGEDPARVFTVGHLALDAIRHLPRLDRRALESELGIDLGAPLLLVTYHPETIGRSAPREAVQTLLDSLDRFSGANVVFTARNADAGHREVGERIREWAATRADRASCFDMLGLERYLSLMALAHAVVGNSSSGVIEAPALGVPSVNIGDRQKNRFKAPPASVIDCGETVDEIGAAISRATTDEFRRHAKAAAARSGVGDAAEKICRALREADLSTLGRKRFRDLPAEALA